MAGETKGKAYEAIVYIVLKQLQEQGKFNGQLFWNETPEGMSIEPDFLIGPDKDNPLHVFMVTHSGSAKESEKKLWRNMGELAETKIFVPSFPSVFNIAFDSIIKEDLKKIQQAAFDGQLLVGDLGYGDDVQRWVDDNQGLLPKGNDAKAEALQELLETDTTLQALIQKLSTDIAVLIKKRRPELDALWEMERQRTPGKTPKRKETFVRRGISKLLIFEDWKTAVKLYRGERVKADDMPQYAYELGLVTRSIGRANPNDPEITNAVELLNDDQIQHIIDHTPLEKLASWLLTLRNAPHLGFMGEYVLREYENLCKPEELAKRLRELHRNPSALTDREDTPENWPPGTVWLCEYLIELVKTNIKKANGYGYAQLGKDVIASDFGKQSDLKNAGQFGGGFGFSAWLHRRKSTFNEELIDGVASVLAGKLKGYTHDGLKKLVADTPPRIIQNTMEAKLVTHKSFEPLFHQISTAGLPIEKLSIRTAFAEAAELKRQSGKTTLAKSKNTLINWQSAHHSHTNDKKKELCGRAVGLRYTWNETQQTFTPRPGVEKLILVLDGTWKQKDLEALIRSGWDEIFYPDEMDKLAAAIV